MHVLVVEDSATLAQLYRLNLARHGCQSEWVTSLAEALAFLDRQGTDIVLLDLSLPDSKGIDTFFRIHEKNETIPIVVLSSFDDEITAMQALKGGAQDYLIKGRATDEAIIRCLRYSIERAQSEAELRQSEKMTRLILENCNDAFWALDEDGEIIGWNHQAEQTFGYLRDEVLGKTLAETVILDRYMESHIRIMNELVRTGYSSILNRRYEILMQTKNKQEIPVEIVAFKVEIGTRHTFCAFAHDITERRNIAERTKRLNEELELRVQERTVELARSNAELRQFAKIASHDLQEPLRTVEGYASLFAKRYRGKLDKDADEFIDYMLDATRRMSALIHDVLQHASIGINQHKPVQVVDSRTVVEQALRNLQMTIGESKAIIEIGDLPMVIANKPELVQLFQNLIGNAIKYRGQKSPVIKITAEENVHEWVFSVEDNGIGIDPKYSEKIFDMFSRLHGKTEYSGSGIGLAICKKIVETHGGRIWVQSEPGQGAIFLFTLLRQPAASN